MKILHVLLTELSIPPQKYGGTERVLWALYQGQKALGHEVRFLLKANISGAQNIQVYDPQKTIESQIQGWADIIHFHSPYEGEIKIPFICTQHGNSESNMELPTNTVFLSKKHAENHNARCYVHNGLYWPDYGAPNLRAPQNYVHFLAKASWRIKNLQGAIKIAQSAKITMHILGGKRANIKRNPYLFLSPQLHFHGMIGGEKKNHLVRNSKGLIFPVLWDEPFGLAVIESLYLGCPVFATEFGALPEIINRSDIGFLSNSNSALVSAVKQIDSYDRKACHEHAKKYFSHVEMATKYQTCYEKVLDHESLNPNKPYTQSNTKRRQKMHK